ncbi:hypothetical protein C1645_803208 [Glomus cerebriforme]|uniref:Uncharacterized protein n=1 Tax=Glomus cerebriforme TaxID=658196 RepID=A0A397T9Y0_9GLOM|nr:hypothetical protein C1645_803208 [Glomus cerebriforme]
MQLESSHHTNTRKRKASEAFDDFDYLYGIVTTGIRGKVNDPYQYGLLDCKELETSRLLSPEISEIKAGIKEINSKLASMQAAQTSMQEAQTSMQATMEEILKQLRDSSVCPANRVKASDPPIVKPSKRILGARKTT